MSAVPPGKGPASTGGAPSSASPTSSPVPAASPSPSPSASAAQPADLNIPMLTDVLHLPRYTGTELPETLTDVDWSALSLRVQENVMERMMRRSEAMLEAQLQQTLHAVLDRHLHSLQSDLHDSLSLLVRDLVARAVADELSRVHNEILRRKSGSRPVG